MNELPYNFDTVEVGDIIQIPYVRSYQHGATMIVTKINRKSFLAQEIEGSYGGPITEEQFRTTHSHLCVRHGRMWKITRNADVRRPFNWQAELARHVQASK
jgi:hypothetical protein